MSTSRNPQARFGQDPADSEELVRFWRETSPAPDTADWSSFWQLARNAAEIPHAEPKFGRFEGKLHWVLAASVAAVMCISWSLGVFVLRNPMSVPVVQKADPKGEIRAIETIRKPVSIDFDENDFLAVIRLDDDQCTSENPCMETVDNYVVGESNETALASNFLLFNELEAIAGD